MGGREIGLEMEDKNRKVIYLKFKREQLQISNDRV